MRRLALLLLACACRHAPPEPPRPPKLSLRHVSTRIEGTSLYRGDVVSVWAVENGLAEPASLVHWRLVATLAGRPLGPLAAETVLTVRPGEEGRVTLTQPVDLELLFAGRIPSFAEYTAELAPESTVTPVRITEQLDLPRPPTVSVAGLHVHKTSMTFEIELSLSVSNENPFPITLEGFSGEVLFAGDRFARFAVAPTTLRPKNREPVPLKLSSSIERLNGLSRAALSSTEAISTDVKATAVIEGRELQLATGSMVWPR